jgi:branched-chain amino acid transport system ATP-binding protein
VSDLHVSGVSKTFGGIRALTDVTFSVPSRSIFGLIGPNGAGKTTVFNLITGVYRPDCGAIRLGSHDVIADNPARIAELGVARTFQNIRLFGQMSVLDNVLVACETTRKSGLFGALARSTLFGAEERAMRERALEMLRVFDLGDMAHDRSTSLSYGNQRRLEIARAMMLRPKVLLLDEPAAGMNYGEAEGLQNQIRWLRERFDLTILLVEHNMQVVMNVCERIHVLDYGQTLAEGAPAEIKRHPKVLEAYLGEGA